METDPLEIFKTNDVNYIRLRLWHSPDNDYCSLAKTIGMAGRIKKKGFKFLLDVHYSDTWADPTNQRKPSAWKSISFEELIDSIYSYTYNVIRICDSMLVLPDIIQIGNEISGGFLWDEGCVKDTFNTPEHWEKFTDLLKAAIQGAEDASPAPIPIMIHTDKGADNNKCRSFFNNLVYYEVPFDIIGLSYYSWWQGSLSQLEANINDLAVSFAKDIIIAETAYPWTLDKADTLKNFVDSASVLNSIYPASVEGQASFLTHLLELVRNIPNGKGKGIFYWAPEYISVPPLYSSWENLTLFDFQGNVLNSIKAFKNGTADSSAAIAVTFNLNTSAHLDTLKPDGYVQLRGEVVSGPQEFVSGEKLSWDANSDVVLSNLNGDYWQRKIRVIPGTEIHYKYWTGIKKTEPTFLRDGWEGPVRSFDSGALYRTLIAGNKDTLLRTEYFNPWGDTLSQYWQPFEHKKDSIGVYFKVNMRLTDSSGSFNPERNKVGVKGDPLDSINILSWDEAKIFLSRDSLSISNGSFWSGTAYFPQNAVGLVQSYKFFIENDNGNFLENRPERTFIIPGGDTTLAWVYFNDRNTIANIGGRIEPIEDLILYQNYPNPFNPSTKISYELKNKTRINLAVFNYLGEEIITLADSEKNPGKFSVEWRGKDSKGVHVSSGIYFIRLTAGTKIKSIKVLLLK